jgi:hypothetical protein
MAMDLGFDICSNPRAEISLHDKKFAENNCMSRLVVVQMITSIDKNT